MLEHYSLILRRRRVNEYSTTHVAVTYTWSALFYYTDARLHGRTVSRIYWSELFDYSGARSPKFVYPATRAYKKILVCVIFFISARLFVQYLGTYYPDAHVTVNR